MDNNFSHSSNPYQQNNTVHPYLQPQPLPWSEGQVEYWSFPEFMGVIQRRWRVTLGVALIVMTTIMIAWAVNKKEPEYESSFQMLVESVNNDNKIVDTNRNSSNSDKSGLDYESQIQVLKGADLMGMIINNLRASYPDITYNSLVRNLTITRLNDTKIIEVSYRSNDREMVKIVLDQIAKDYLTYSLKNVKLA